MRKFVKYVGKTTRSLVKGKCYLVKEFDLHNNIYTLETVEGVFPRYMFEEVSERYVQQKSTYIAFSKTMPKIGDELFLVRIEKGNIQPVRTSAILDISYVEGDIYRIETENSVYLTEIKE